MTTSPLQHVLCDGTARQAIQSTTLLCYYGLLVKNTDVRFFFYGNSRYTVYFATTVYLYLRCASVYIVRINCDTVYYAATLLRPTCKEY